MNANLVDQVLDNWDYWSIGHAAVDRWDHRMFAERVFPGWTVTALLTRPDEVAMVLRRDDTYFVLPFEEPEDSRDGRRLSFDAAMTDSVFGTSPITLIDTLTAHEVIPPRVLLAIEAVIVSVATDEQQALRTMMALRGVTAPTYERVI